MINEEVQRQVANYWMEQTMTEEEYLALESILVDEIWETQEQATDDELVQIGVKRINQMLIEREERGLV
ncbi:hypothetical protein LOSG293_220030 [Secundilactobacillus oryzae JCM 18671]|uniref:Uncharacterized protein n=1 Tax=Secundilactobacillus oryzae JCM 18671 TaxID=1291743 RepID=A0A081BJJ8_9LACO|nr:hypothetical protein [Secundilactobacillus oryzae]GAK48216.1 hypothetical protein LOSG293_220030 [Secundilactobacillus oryzae JCM 18671]